MSETIGRMIQRLRVERGMTQQELAAAAEVNLGTLRNWEIDYREPNLFAALRIARALGFAAEDFLGAAKVDKATREPRRAGPTLPRKAAAKPKLKPKKAGRPRKPPAS